MIKKYKLFLENANLDNSINDIKDILTELTDENLLYNVFTNDDGKIHTEIMQDLDNDEVPFTEEQFNIIKEILISVNKYVESNDYLVENIMLQYVYLSKIETIVIKKIEDISIDCYNWQRNWRYMLYNIFITIKPTY